MSKVYLWVDKITTQEFLKYYDGYINRFKLVNPEGNESENDVRWTCEALLAAEVHDAPAPQQMLIGLLTCADFGILKINPENDNQNSMDNYIPFLYVMRGTNYAKSICEYGVKHWWWFRNKNQDESFISPYMGRYAAFRAMAKMAGDEKLNCLDIKLFKLAIDRAIKTTGTDQDGRCLTTFMFNLASEHKVFKNDPWFIVAKINWKNDFKRHWPNGYGEVLLKYHGHETPNSKLLWGYFGK